MHCETDINECASNPCANGGVCIDLVNGFRCECPRGYYDARCLSDVDECKSNPCKHGGSCEDGVNQFICHCLPGKKETIKLFLFIIIIFCLQKVTVEDNVKII